MHSILSPFPETSANQDVYKAAEIVENLANEILTSQSSKIFELYNGNNSKIAIKNTLISLITQTRKGLGYDSMNLADMVLEKIYDYYPVKKYMDMKNVSDIIIAGPNDIHYKIKGKMYDANDIVFVDMKALTAFVYKAVWMNGGELTVQKPYYLGFDKNRKMRITAAIPPYSEHPNIHFRLHRLFDTTLEDMHGVHNMFNLEILEFIQTCIRKGLTILVVGSPGSGKTTLARAIINEISPDVASVSVEESQEWFIEKKNHRSYFILQRYNETDREMAYDMSTLSGIIRFLLVAGTSCICIGEIKGPEAFDILQAYMTGNYGVNTFHVSDIRETHVRFANMATMNLNARNYTNEKLESMFASSFDIVIHMENFKIKDICEVDYKNSEVVYNHLFEYVGNTDMGFHRSVQKPSDKIKAKLERKDV